MSSVVPNSGPTAGGTAVTITGTNFAAGATVTFGSDGGDERGGGERDQITATTPAGSAGAVTVTVTVERAERKSGERVHLCGGADGEQCSRRTTGRRRAGRR